MIQILIIEDEKPAREYLRKLLLKHYAEVEVIEIAENAETGYNLIMQKKPDIVFLDIELPGRNGFTLLEECNPVSFEVIFTTAFSNYATRAFEYFALGYLLKPIEELQLKKNMDEAIQRIDRQKINHKLEMMLEMVRTRDNQQSLPLPTQNGFELVQAQEIIYCRSEGNYTHFHFKDRKSMIVSKQLGIYEKLLPSAMFVRIHSQYIINTRFVARYSKGTGGTVTLSTGESLPVSANRKQEFIERFM